MNFLNIFQKKARPEFHPVTKKPIKYAFNCGKNYYRFTNDYDMPQDRAWFLMQFANEAEMKITKEKLVQFIEAMEKALNEGKLNKCFQILSELKYRDEWAFEPDSLYRLASCIYFDLDEDIKTYDADYNEKKISRFKKKEMLRYFLEQLWSGQNPFVNLSPEASRLYLSKLKEVLQKQESLITLQREPKTKGKKERQITG